jgi:hypothetical protein
MRPVLRNAAISALVSAWMALNLGLGAQQPGDALRGKSAQQILDCARDEACKSQYDQFLLADALSKPGNISLLIGSYPKADDYVKGVIVMALFSLRGPKVETFMRGIAFKDLKPHRPDYAPGWYPLQYLARGCNGQALARLSRPENITKGYPIACMQWQETVKAFGDCKYRPAIPYLIEALSTACLNIDSNASEALKKLLPGTCEDKKWPDAMQKCYRRVAQERGYKIFQ